MDQAVIEKNAPAASNGHMTPQPASAAPARLLVVDDNAAVLDAYRKVLTPARLSSEALDVLEAALFDAPLAASQSHPNFQVDYLQDGEQAARQALAGRNEERPYAVAFVDMRMPGGWDGMQTIEALWQADPRIQVVICTAYSDHSWEDITNRLGWSDRLLILRKPFEKVEVLQMASALSRKWMLHRELQLELDVLECSVAQRTFDLTEALAEREAYATQLQFQATHDTLTGLANRNLLRDRLSQAIAYASRYGHPIWVAFLDLDRFKVINDTLGHRAGDTLLNTIADRLKLVLREADAIARIGGDEFVLVLRGPEHSTLSAATLQRIMTIVAEPIILEARPYSISCSVGVAVYPSDGTTPETLIEHADIAMYRAKESGRGNFQFFTQEMNLRLLERANLEQALRAAIARDEFVVHYQPQVDLRSGRIIGMEALIRWNHPQMGMVSPARFISVAEESGLIGQIGLWVLRTACAQCRKWQRHGMAPLRVAVNLSARQMADKHLVESIAAVLEETELPPSLLEIEITESSVMSDVDHSIAVLRAFKDLGVQLAIDDFGTGYSSLSYLKRFPIDVLKIDQSFVHDVESDPDSAAIVVSIISLAHSLRLQVIAEGVETAAQLAYLQRNDCDYIQGFHFCRPLAALDFEALLFAEKSLAIDTGEDAPARETLLIVDDEAPILEMLKLVLEQDGYQILVAQTATEAFDLLASNQVHVVICDQRMPGMDGIAFLSKIKNLYPAAVRVMLSAHDESKMIIGAINQGAIFSYFVKPCDSATLRHGVRNAFRHHRDHHAVTHREVH
ncbi:MAG: EAL domain-containing protein [Pseudomonadota bacterium]